MPPVSHRAPDDADPATKSEDSGATAGVISTVADFVLRADRADLDRVAVIDGGRKVSWAELGRGVRGRAAGLGRLGLHRGDRVVLQAGTGLDFVEVYLGALHAGLVVVPVSPAYTTAELRHVLSDSGARALVTSSVAAVGAAAEFSSELPDLEFVVAAIPGRVAGEDSDGVRPLSDLIEDGADPAQGANPPAPAPEDLAVILYTSGTSGVPKGAMLTHRAVLGNVEHIVAITPPLLTERDVLFLPVPLSHIFGLNAGLAPALALGATVVLNDRFDAEHTLELITAERVTAVVGAPGMFAAWSVAPDLASAMTGVRLGLCGSAPLPPGLVAVFARAGVPLHEGYGMTEAAPVVALNLVAADGSSRLGHPKAGSVGVPPPGVEVELRDVEGDAVEDDDPGRLAVRGANLFSGYWPDGAGGPDSDGWFVTGDLAYRDDDGDLVLVGRDSELVLVNGFNVYPAEVESVFTALDGVSAAAVVGVPDDVSGEALRAYVVADPGRELVPDALLADAARSLARFKLPRRVDVVDALPYTLTGKVKKWQLP